MRRRSSSKGSDWLWASPLKLVRRDGEFSGTRRKREKRPDAEAFHALGLEILGQDEKLSGRLRVTCPAAFAAEHMPRDAARFVERHPEIRIDVSPGHGAMDLNKREAEIAIRATRFPPDAAFGRKIFPSGSPSKARQGTLKPPRACPSSSIPSA